MSDTRFLPKYTYEITHENGGNPVTYRAVSDLNEREMIEHIKMLQQNDLHMSIPFTIKKIDGLTSLPPQAAEALAAVNTGVQIGKKAPGEKVV